MYLYFFVRNASGVVRCSQSDAAQTARHKLLIWADCFDLLEARSRPYQFFPFSFFFPADAVERNSKKTKTAWSKEGTDENAIGEENM